ncbi:MAG: caspase family protein [Cyclobacteriaceae bacterium]|nr:caspase family protein [Cyclobacteriaceae bacterium]
MKGCTVFLLFCLFSGTLPAQSFSNKTNSISVDYTRPVVATTLPEITWTSPKIESSVSTLESLSVEAMVKSDVLLKEIKLVVTHGEESLEKKIPIQQGQRTYTIRQNVRLQNGGNTIKIIVENVDGGKVSSTRAVLVGKDAIADAVDVSRRDYALIFATDKYDNWEDLVNPIQDAEIIAGLLKDKYGFTVELVENATLEEVTAKLYDYNTRKFNPQDQLFVFFAGHGYYDEVLGEGYVVASNSLMNDKGKNSYLAHSILRQRLDNIRCEHIFLAMDVCFGGTFDPILARNRAGEVMEESTDTQYLVKKLSKRTRKYLTSGSKEYVSDGIPGKNSPFAAKFIQALREIGGGSGRILTLAELNTYFQRLTTDPRSGSFGTDDPASDFVFVAKN